MAWSVKVDRKVTYAVDVLDKDIYKLPDHHDEYGEAWWIDGDVPVVNMKRVFSGDK